jgi:hypothetical protein
VRIWWSKYTSSGCTKAQFSNRYSVKKTSEWRFSTGSVRSQYFKFLVKRTCICTINGTNASTPIVFRLQTGSSVSRSSCHIWPSLTPWSMQKLGSMDGMCCLSSYAECLFLCGRWILPYIPSRTVRTSLFLFGLVWVWRCYIFHLAIYYSYILACSDLRQQTRPNLCSGHDASSVQAERAAVDFCEVFMLTHHLRPAGRWRWTHTLTVSTSVNVFVLIQNVEWHTLILPNRVILKEHHHQINAWGFLMVMYLSFPKNPQKNVCITY